jgi:bifunctional UDP-N-acetylglucosamine pyrophosphorylase/glucosamine-1-phosphate N-acetyltransferase
MSERPLLTVILAAGKGTRMKSALPKVLHALAGRSLLGHVLALARDLGGEAPAVVVGPAMEEVAAEARRWAPAARIFVQERQAGTADALLAARAALAQGAAGDVLVLYGDTPLIEAGTIARLRAALDAGAAVAVLGFEAREPHGYGRLLTDAAGALCAIREEKDATAEEREVRLCNSGVLAFRLPDLVHVLESIGNRNAKAEYYLTDAVAIVRAKGGTAVAVRCGEDEVLGINARDELAAAEAIYQDRRRREVMRAGATLIAPETVWFSYDTRIGRDVMIEPNVFFGPGVEVEDGVVIKANCHLQGFDQKSRGGVRIRAGAEIGPFARIRPGSDIGPGVHVGNFVEVKNATMGEGAKANHLAYVGDGRVGRGANIGAGTIFCNYDGFNKHVTEVGEGAFIGSNSSLVAPVRIGAGAYVGSGSVITRNVSDDALALERTSQEERPGWAAKFRAMMHKRKARSG